MGKESSISWCNASWNPWHGCKKISEGCKYCYMFRDKAKYGQDATVIQRSKTRFRDPLHWKEKKIIFTCSWSDFFIEEADAWREEAWKIIRTTPQHTYQILTKRPERIKDCLPTDWGTGYDNVWLGVTVENQKTIERCNVLGEIPAKIRFISAEPLIGEVDFVPVFENYIYHWLILGAESGNETGKFRYRSCEISWLKNIITDCKNNNVAVWVKQLGTYLAKDFRYKDRHGADISEFPTSLQIQDFPKGAMPHLPMPELNNAVMDDALLLKEPVSCTSKKQTAEKYVNSLSPFKKEIGLAILSGENPEEVAVRFSKERNKPLKTYKAYVTMVANALKSI